MTKTINTYGSIQLITLKKFISLLGIIEAPFSQFPFDTCTGYRGFSPYAVPDTLDGVISEVSNYKRLIAYPSFTDPIRACITALGHQGSHKHVFKCDLSYLLENAVLEQIGQYGAPSYAVRLAPRTWIVVDLADYNLIHFKPGYDLACYAQNRTIINEVLRVTKEIAIKLSDK
jgi:hypothetical protein